MTRKSEDPPRQQNGVSSLNSDLRHELSKFTRFRVRMWLDSNDGISLYRIEPIESLLSDLLYEYDEVSFAQYILSRKLLEKMLSILNSRGFYKSNRIIDSKLVGKLSISDLRLLNPRNIEYKAYGEFHEGDSTSFNSIEFMGPTKLIFFNTDISRTPPFSSGSLFSKDHPYFPTKEKAFNYLMGLNINRNRDDLNNGVMFFLPLSTFLIERVSILGTKLRLSFKGRQSKFGFKIFYENKYLGRMESVQDKLRKEYQLAFPPIKFNLVVHNDEDIVDRVTFDFNPQNKPEIGRVRFVYTRDYIQTLVDNGENVEIEFKGYKNLEFNHNNLIETIVAFTNTQGGIILLGVEDKKNVKDNKQIIGFKQQMTIGYFREWLVSLIKGWCDPIIDFSVDEIYMVSGERVILIHVGLGRNRPYFKKTGERTGIFVRVNDSDELCDRTRFDDFMKNIDYCRQTSLL